MVINYHNGTSDVRSSTSPQAQTMIIHIRPRRSPHEYNRSQPQRLNLGSRVLDSNKLHSRYRSEGYNDNDSDGVESVASTLSNLSIEEHTRDVIVHPAVLQNLSSHLHDLARKLLEKRSTRYFPVGLRINDAQELSDLFHKVLWKKELQNENARSLRDFLRKCIIKFVQAYGVPPAAVCLKGIVVNPESEGGGSFGDVYKGTYQGKLVAVKCHRYYQSMPDSIKQEYHGQLCLEAMLLMHLDHSNVLPFLGIDWFNNWDKKIGLVVPWRKNQSIRHFLDTPEGRNYVGIGIDYMTQIDTWLYQISCGLEYLHEEGVVHGDLRGANILVTDDFMVQLSDFGSAVLAEATSKGYCSARACAERWQAPELMHPELYGLGSERPTYASDIYAFGCVCIELYTQREPWFGCQRSEVWLALRPESQSRHPRPNFQNLPRDVEYSDELWRITKRCWTKSSHLRPTAQQLRIMVEELPSIQYPSDTDSSDRRSYVSDESYCK
ncbi:kinase-like domain-containing protein [Abortiporus biennis]|nr:kinase-like domain-containing protein [Abortiporus biennis]